MCVELLPQSFKSIRQIINLIFAVDALERLSETQPFPVLPLDLEFLQSTDQFYPNTLATFANIAKLLFIFRKRPCYFVRPERAF